MTIHIEPGVAELKTQLLCAIQNHGFTRLNAIALLMASIIEQQANESELTLEEVEAFAREGRVFDVNPIESVLSYLRES